MVPALARNAFFFRVSISVVKVPVAIHTCKELRKIKDKKNKKIEGYVFITQYFLFIFFRR